MNRTYRCKACGRIWTSEDTIFDYIQECPSCDSRTAPDKLPKTIHYMVRGPEPRHALCSTEIHDGLDNTTLKRTTCVDCLAILSRGEGLYRKCLYCRNFTQANNRPDYAFCVAEPPPTDVEFDPRVGKYLSMDLVDRGCVTRFEFTGRWKNFFEDSLASDRKWRDKS